jgi:hypothetical protein
MIKHAIVAIEALVTYRSDDLARAKDAFKHCGPPQMLQQHAASGRTRQEVLDEYQQREDTINAAIAWVRQMAERAPPC